MGLGGWVQNVPDGVCIEVEGNKAEVLGFVAALQQQLPPAASIEHMRRQWLQAVGAKAFRIKDSAKNGRPGVVVSPDLALCDECRREIFDSANRRYRYAFTSCANCGPRFSILESLPYDRINTSMRHFALCEACQAEFDDPLNRRFHHQANACSECGPQLELWDSQGGALAQGDEALIAAAASIREGGIVAAKGLGGFHLIVDAGNEHAISTLRKRKQRPAKPFAIMYPSLGAAKAHCHLSIKEEGLLASAIAPIVLSACRTHKDIAPSVAPDNPYLGIMLPYTPMHELLLQELDVPVVATSGNCSGEPIVSDEHKALERLQDIADLFLVHNRPIAWPVDDSVAQLVAGKPLLLRRSRGYVPRPVTVKGKLPPVLAMGGDLKNSIAITRKNEVVLGPYVGDVESAEARAVLARTVTCLPELFGAKIKAIACDLHPDYSTTILAEDADIPCHHVQHHMAHIAACMAEHRLQPPLLGVAWDGTGFGMDGTIWGGEFFLVDDDGMRRAAHMYPFRLPGGSAAVREPRRSALGVLHAIFGDQAFARKELAPLRSFHRHELKTLLAMLSRGVNAPVTTSVGRLFDAVGSILDLRQQSSFEGETAMQLQFVATESDDRYSLPFNDEPAVADWRPMLQGLLHDLAAGLPIGEIAAKFHNSLTHVVVEIAQKAGVKTVALTGGCFQNRYLLEKCIQHLRKAGFSPYWPQQVPVGDGGLALGQAMLAGGAHVPSHSG